MQWCLIMYLDRGNENGLAKGRPTGGILARRSPLGRSQRSSLGDWLFSSFDVMACAAGCSSVQMVPRIADMNLSKYNGLLALSLL